RLHCISSAGFVSVLCVVFYMSVFCLFHHLFLFIFNDTATTEIYTLSLHDALPICFLLVKMPGHRLVFPGGFMRWREQPAETAQRSEEHTSELQSPDHLVCRLLLEKKKKKTKNNKSTQKQATNNTVSIITIYF